MQRNLLFALLTGLLAIHAAACTSLDTHVEITGSLHYGSCGDILPWEPTFATWTDTGGADGMLRIQSLPGPVSAADDTIAFIINNPEELYDTLGQAIEVGDRYRGGAPASGSIAFPVRCPEEKSLAVQLHGDLVFQELSPNTRGRVIGYFEGTAIDGRTSDELSDHLRIDFDFPRRFQAPWQTFPTDQLK